VLLDLYSVQWMAENDLDTISMVAMQPLVSRLGLPSNRLLA